MVTRRLPAEISLCAVLVVTLLATLAGPAWAAFPTTAQEQAAWLGDVHAAGLREHYPAPEAGQPQGLSDQSIATTRDALVAGIESLLKQPLTVEQLSELTAWVSRSTAMSNYPPPDLELLSRRANLLQIIELYLARPPFHTQEAAELLYKILGQVSGLLDVLRQSLAGEYSDVPGADQMAAAAVFSAAAIIAEEARSPVSPFAKRLLTEEEVATLTQQAQQMASQARAQWASHHQQWLERTGPPDPLSCQHAASSMQSAAGDFEGAIRMLYYRARQVVTPEQQAAVWEYYHNLWLADLAAKAAEGSDE